MVTSVYARAPCRPGTATFSELTLSVVCKRATRTGEDAAERFLPLDVTMRAACGEALVTHGVADIVALDGATTKASGGGDMQTGAGCAKT
jgi:hypothetical protein